MKNETLIITRTFDAPRELVFNAFSNVEALNAWWGPVQMKNTVISLDFKVGGIFHYKMEGHGQINYARFLFTEINPFSKLVFKLAFVDEELNIIPPPFPIKFPMEILYDFNFSETNKKTTLTMTAIPVNGTAEEIEGFIGLNDSMQQGFGASLNNLETYLSNMSTHP
ncbi:SRPBCC domain-containing protein [Pedobacter sp. ISL-68]|uniref:SRPBCC family protein n=1 Tax=unclassified Pedobacter TaxID=2628915 RepID=UPI001BEA43FF|nr:MULTISPECIES: SRPBCC domain-containing protein [unclassified Pedobacter]MBT2564709.1 SRPBCC domain-containing protein [Pedobacter sp. ISL-64]MBT2592402.1 SRPBCC domain-containing protein [Pedobacter sp. ISL-68]